MVYLAMFHWGWLLASLLLGFAMGWIAVVQRGQGLTRKTAQWLAVLTVALIVAAVTRVVPGRFGYWLDLGLVMLVAYLVGCTIGSWLRERMVSRQMAPSRSGDAAV
jgi:membrane protease YdiL (CAAX protease family)